MDRLHRTGALLVTDPLEFSHGMEKYIVPVDPPSNPKNPNPNFRPQWKRIFPELNGRIPSKHRHEDSQLLLNSYSEVRAFGHCYSIGSESCPTYAARMSNAVNQDRPNYFLREGISGLEFDSKGVYLASITKSGCLTVHDFETLYCTVHNPSNDSRDLLHISTSQTLDAVRWNPTNEDEVLQKGTPKFSRQNGAVCNGLSDIAFASSDKSRLLASGLDGAVYVWDRRLGNCPCVELNATSPSQLNSIQLEMENRVVFGASKQGIIYAWDLRGGRTSVAFQSLNEVYNPPLTSLKVSSMLEKITSLKAQSNIMLREIHSIRFDPSCSYQLAFHLDDGWSGILNINSLKVTHMHCPPPAWLDGMETPSGPLYLRKPAWLPSSSIYVVGSSSGKGIYLLDFYPDKSSACHVDASSDDFQSVLEESKGIAHNRFCTVSEPVLVCASHPINSTIIAGSKHSSLLLISQKQQADSNLISQVHTIHFEGP